MSGNKSSCHVAIVGAGPYGLAAAAHLRAAGIETRVFGEPMEFWERHMPRGMFLRSSPVASQIGDPDGGLTLRRYYQVRGIPASRPLPVDHFIGYGHWFQQQVAADLDRRRVARIESDSTGFRLRLHDGEEVSARRVVVATGISPFPWRPPEFDALPTPLASHTSDHHDFAGFAGRKVVVVGAGQSALESAALLHEAGAEVEVVARARAIYWLKARKKAADPRSIAALIASARRLLQPLARPKFDIMGPRLVSWLLAWPRGYRRAPAALKRLLTAAAVRPAGAAWLVPRLAGVPLSTGRAVIAAVPAGSRIHLVLDDGTERRVDHLLLGTGYRVDVRRYPFLAPPLKAALQVRDGYPDLKPGFESSVPGLHFLGTPAARSFGPICRFVVGSGYSGRAVARRIARGARNGARNVAREVVPIELPGRASHAV